MRKGKADDAGFTLIELIVAIGVFGTLMAVVGSATIAAMAAIRNTTSTSQVQQDSQNAMEWVSALLRYTDLPEGQVSAVPTAGAATITLYSYASAGRKIDVPYRITMGVTANSNGTRTLYADAFTPTKAAAGWTWASTASRRRLLTVPNGTGSPLTLVYYACDPTSSCNSTRHQLTTPATPGALTITAPEVLESIKVSIGDPAKPASMLTQSVQLVNMT